MEDERVPDALAAFGRILALDDAHGEAHYYIGAVHAKERRYAEAMAAWQQVIAIDPTTPLAQQARRHLRSAEDLSHIFRTEAA